MLSSREPSPQLTPFFFRILSLIYIYIHKYILPLHSRIISSFIILRSFKNYLSLLYIYPFGFIYILLISTFLLLLYILIMNYNPYIILIYLIIYIIFKLFFIILMFQCCRKFFNTLVSFISVLNIAQRVPNI